MDAGDEKQDLAPKGSVVRHFSLADVDDEDCVERRLRDDVDDDNVGRWLQDEMTTAPKCAEVKGSMVLESTMTTTTRMGRSVSHVKRRRQGVEDDVEDVDDVAIDKDVVSTTTMTSRCQYVDGVERQRREVDDEDGAEIRAGRRRQSVEDDVEDVAGVALDKEVASTTTTTRRCRSVGFVEQRRDDVEDEVEGAAGVALDNDVDDDENTLFWQHVTGATTVCQDAALDKDVNHEGDDADERVGPRCDDDEV